MENNLKNTLLMASIGVLIGIVGIVAYNHQIKWLMVTCAVLCLGQLLINLFFGLLQDYTYPMLSACFLIGYFITETIADSFCYGICLYYVIAVFYIGILMVIPLHIILIIVSVVSLIAYFINKEYLFLVTALYCSLNFVNAHLRGKLPHYAMDIYLLCATFGIMLLFQRNTESYYTTKLLKGVLWGGAAYYIFGVLYAFYCSHIKKENLTDKNL